MTTTSDTIDQDPFFYDTDRLHNLTTDTVVKQGLEYFKENRVIDLDWDQTRLWAQVEGSNPEEPYSVELRRNDKGELWVSCPCTNGTEPVCKHAVAALYRYAAEVSADREDLVSAVDSAIEERTQRGRTEVKVQHLTGDPWFGTWRAASVASTTHRPQSYTVHIRSLDERRNYCTCPDLATNQLGTCKHIEAVLHKIRHRRDYKKIKNQPPPMPYVYLAWDVDDPPRIRVQRTSSQRGELNTCLQRYFDSAGLFKGRLPDEFFGFGDAVYGRDDIHVGEDAQLHVRRLAADAAHQLRAREIRQQITQSGGVLPGLRARLYPYQMEGVAFLAATGRALLADDMGLGKTLQSIAAAGWLARNAEVERILVVCPASLKHQWAREIQRFTEHEVQIIQGGPEIRNAQYRKVDAFAVVNYELVLRDLSVINEILRPDLLILDEAQRIKNWRTKIASTIKLIPSRYAFVLTGTPLENRLEDLYSLMQVVDPRVLGPLWRYLLDFHVTDERGKVIGYRNLTELRRRLAPVMLRRDRRLVRDQLPERTEIRLDLPMSVKQQELHNSAMSAAGQLAQIAKRRPLTPSEQNRLMASLQQARMACDAAGLVDGETQGSPKLDELRSLLDDLCLQDSLKVVVFSQWERMTVMVEQTVKRLGIGSVRLHGGVPTAKRGDLMDRFREDDATQVFISTDAGGVGLNLQSASVLINLDMPWNPAVLEQRIARVHRLGQKDIVQVILMVAADSYEEQVMQLVQGKRDLFDNVVATEATEDVVGVSKRMLETLVEDLAGEKEAKPVVGERIPQVPESEWLPQTAPRGAKEAPETEQDAAIRRCIEDIQNAFGSRVERILGSGGGLLVVMVPIESGDERTAEALSDAVPVALIEPRTLAGLQRLGAASPVGETHTLFDAGAEAQRPRASPLLRLAQEKLQSAEVLIEQKHAAGAVELLSSAMLSAAAGKADLSQAPNRDQAAVWVYSQAVPKGVLLPEQAGTVMRALSLSQAPEVPESLLFEVLEDARMLVEQAGTRA